MRENDAGMAWLRKALREKNEIIKAYAGPEGRTPEGVRYAILQNARSADLLRPVVQEMREFPNNVFGDWADRIEQAIAGGGRDE